MATWHTGAAWRVVNSLNQLNAQLRNFAPHAVPPATNANAWGSIADDAHSTSSDHYPHYYGALGSTAVVCARDFPHAPVLGLDGGAVTEAIRMARPAACQYVIFNRRITGVNYGWTWHTYTGSDPHDTHFHVSSVHDGRADSTTAWALPGAISGAAMTDLSAQNAEFAATAAVRGDATFVLNAGAYKGTNVLHQKLDALVAAVAAVAKAQGIAQADLDALEARPEATLTDAQIGLIADRLIASNTNGLTAADHAGVLADVKQALREGATA